MMNLIRAMRVRPRLFISLLLVVILAVLLPASIRLSTRCLIAWCIGSASYVVLVTAMMVRAPLEKLKRMASAMDDSAVIILVLCLAAILASIVAVVAELSGMQGVTPELRAFHLALAAATIVCSWFFTQVVFAVHYTHVFFGEGEDGKHRAGLDFGGRDHPDFWDFLYFTVTIGATSQTSDTNVRTHLMRRIVLAQAIVAFFFNTTILALAINIAASAL